MIPTLYTQSITKEGENMMLDNLQETEVMKCSKSTSDKGLGLHAAMHISIYTEAFRQKHPQEWKN